MGHAPVLVARSADRAFGERVKSWAGRKNMNLTFDWGWCRSVTQEKTGLLEKGDPGQRPKGLSRENVESRRSRGRMGPSNDSRPGRTVRVERQI